MEMNDRKILARACGIEDEQYYWCAKCQEELIPERVTYQETCVACGFPVILRGGLPTLTTSDDWEMVRVKVVLSRADAFSKYLHHEHHEFMCNHYSVPFASWLLTRGSETLCQLVCDFIKSRHDLFPWVGEMEGK